MEATEFVWIISEHTLGWVINRGAYVSVVKYTIDDKLYTQTFENEELLEWGNSDNWTE